jgi:hypothetical protein
MFRDIQDHIAPMEALVAKAGGADVEVDGLLYGQFEAMSLLVDQGLARALEDGLPALGYMTMTPGGALYLLSINQDNRKLKPMKIEQYESDMRTGKWLINGVGLIVSEDRFLNDGQNRLLACFRSGSTVTMQYSIGCSRESRATVDINATRSPTDTIAMDGQPYPQERCAISKMVLGITRAGMRKVGCQGNIANSDIIELASDPRIGAAAAWVGANRAQISPLMSSSVAGTLHYFLKPRESVTANHFLEGVRTGINLGERDPRIKLREALQRMKGSARGYSPQRLSLAIQAWNHFAAGEEVGALRKPDKTDLPVIALALADRSRAANDDAAVRVAA